MSRNAPIHRARTLRQQANRPEQLAWATLRKLRSHGFPVRRQMPLAGYTVDFAIHRARLVIEIDGAVHLEDGAVASDAARDREIEARGWRVLRVPAETAQDGDALWALVLSELGVG